VRATLGIDLGTGSTKAALVDDAGRPVAESWAAHSAAAEVDTRLWWRSTVRAVRGVLAQAGRSCAVAAVGLTGQMHGVVLVDRRLRPLMPAITWASVRSPDEVARLAAPYAASLANPVVAGMPAVTLFLLNRQPTMWNVPIRPGTMSHRRQTAGGLDDTHLALQPKDWLGARLTGEAVTDPTDASATLLWDFDTAGWHRPWVQALGLDAALLPPVAPSDDLRGVLLPAAAAALGLPAGLPVTVGRGDTPAALVGSGTAGRGAGGAQVSVGTGAQICRIVDTVRPDPTRRTHLYCGPGPAQWYAMAATLSAGLALEWVRRVLRVSWPRLYSEAFDCPPGADGVVFLPYLAGERTPYLDPRLSAAWRGLRLEHGRPQLLRAALEGSAFALRDAWDALLAAGHDADAFVLAGGGTMDPRWRQLLADVLRRPLTVTPHGAGSARGAALSAAVALHWFPDLPTAAATAGTPHLVAEPGRHDYAVPLARFRAHSREVSGRGRRGFGGPAR
jgi:xylulokinase